MEKEEMIKRYQEWVVKNDNSKNNFQYLQNTVSQNWLANDERWRGIASDDPALYRAIMEERTKLKLHNAPFLGIDWLTA
jgi:hypothetical protein